MVDKMSLSVYICDVFVHNSSTWSFNSSVLCRVQEVETAPCMAPLSFNLSYISVRPELSLFRSKISCILFLTLLSFLYPLNHTCEFQVLTLCHWLWVCQWHYRCVKNLSIEVCLQILLDCEDSTVSLCGLLAMIITLRGEKIKIAS